MTKRTRWGRKSAVEVLQYLNATKRRQQTFEAGALYNGSANKLNKQIIAQERTGSRRPIAPVYLLPACANQFQAFAGGSFRWHRPFKASCRARAIVFASQMRAPLHWRGGEIGACLATRSPMARVEKVRYVLHATMGAGGGVYQPC